jgi:hypothetical protein
MERCRTLKRNTQLAVGQLDLAFVRALPAVLPLLLSGVRRTSLSPPYNEEAVHVTIEKGREGSKTVLQAVWRAQVDGD